MSGRTPPSPGPSPSPSRNTLGVPPSHKPSVPVNLEPYVSEALEAASEHIGRTPSLRNIRLVKAPSSEQAAALAAVTGATLAAGGGDDASPGVPTTPRRRKSSVLNVAANVFRRRREEEETALVFAFDGDSKPNISVTEADSGNPLGMEREEKGS